MLTKILKGAAIATVVASVFAPMAFATDVTITGNGADSHSTVNVTTTNSTTVEQESSTSNSTVVSTTQNTGNVDANKNTGGSVDVTTGDANSTTTVKNVGSQNNALVPPPCGCNADPAAVLITLNGAKSKNKVNLTNTNVAAYGQSSVTVNSTVVGTSQTTGNVDANSNTGPGSVSVSTGGTTSKVKVKNFGSVNNLGWLTL